MTQLICLHKILSYSNSPEANLIKEEYPDVRYNFCKKHCSGYHSCENYIPREINDAEGETLTARVELFEDMVGRLEDFEFQAIAREDWE